MNLNFLRKKYLLYLNSVLAVFLIVIIISLSGYDSKPSPFLQPTETANPNLVVFVSDSQDPIWIEKFFLKENHNILAKEMIFSEIVKLSPSTVFHLGDLVALGFWNKEWIPIDHFTSSLKKNNIDFYPILGNHELFFPAQLGLKNFIARFPFQSETGYSVQRSGVAYILLNSNFGILTSAEIEEQNNWFKKSLLKFDNDPQINFVIVAAHHSPFTNSKIVGINEDVQKYFVPAFIGSSKAKVFISGHAHAFEHFKVKGKDFLVIGGGGGLQHPLYTGNEEKYKNLYDSLSTTIMFHFLTVDTYNDSLKFSVMMLDKKFTSFENVYSITVKKSDFNKKTRLLTGF
jgi:hypothetical protein